jgi:hypothetical protein
MAPWQRITVGGIRPDPDVAQAGELGAVDQAGGGKAGARLARQPCAQLSRTRSPLMWQARKLTLSIGRRGSA